MQAAAIWQRFDTSITYWKENVLNLKAILLMTRKKLGTQTTHGYTILVNHG
jgi:hypothetical protein